MNISALLKKWSENRNIVIGTLIFLYPLGVYLMWKGKHFNPDLRWMITGLLLLWTMYLGSGDTNNETGFSSCSETMYANGCTYYRDSGCNVIAKSCD